MIDHVNERTDDRILVSYRSRTVEDMLLRGRMRIVSRLPVLLSCGRNRAMYFSSLIYIVQGFNYDRWQGVQLGRVRVGDHLWINLSRRSICDNCSAELCVYDRGERTERCEHFTPSIMAFKKCERCGSIYEVSSNFRALNYDLCPRCNSEVILTASL